MALFDVLSRLVKVKNVHYDRKSREGITKIVKPKYKLVGNPLKDLDQFIFFVLSSSPRAYHKRLLVKVGSEEWLNKDSAQSSRLCGVAHIDITRYELLTSRTVGLKIADRKNGFKYVAELPEIKFKELQKKLLQLKYMKRPVPSETKRLIAGALQATATDIMRSLGI